MSAMDMSTLGPAMSPSPEFECTFRLCMANDDNVLNDSENEKKNRFLTRKRNGIGHFITLDSSGETGFFPEVSWKWHSNALKFGGQRLLHVLLSSGKHRRHVNRR